MKKSDLVKKLAERSNISVAKAKQVVDTVFSSMSEELAKGDKIEIRGFASFKIKTYQGYTGRNPKSGANVEVGPKKGIVFKVGQELRDYLKVNM